MRQTPTPRLDANITVLYAPGLPTCGSWDTIAPVISNRPINWDLIAQQYATP